MNLTKIREAAKALKVKNYSRLKKDELIPAIQLAEGNTDCWKKIPDCWQADCCWREECVEART